MPVGMTAIEQMAGWEVDDDTKVLCLSFGAQSYFSMLSSSGVFQAINVRCGGLIDDCEEECLEASQVGVALKAVRE